MQTVYIETTIPSFYHTERKDTRSLARKRWTREWWDTVRTDFECYSSDAVVAELDRGTIQNLRTKRIELIAELPFLEINNEIEDIAKSYVEQLLMPKDGSGDALHLAVASFYAIDVLLTWNCKHLANPNKFGHIEQINERLGLTSPLLTTPLNFLSEDDTDEG